MVEFLKYLSYPMIAMQTIRQFFSPYPVDTDRLSIHALGIQERMSPAIVNRPAGTGDYLFMFFYDPVVLNMDRTPREYPPHTLILWGPQHGHYYGNTEGTWMHSWLHCAGTGVQEMLAECALPLNVPLAQPNAEVCERYLSAIYREVTLHAQPDEVIVRNALHSWTREILRALAGTAAIPRIPPRFLAVQQYIHTCFDQQITLPALAARAHLSVPHFCSEFKRYFGAPAIAYLLQVRLRHAVYLLRDRHLSITEIAQRVGYPEVYHFSKLFKQHYQLSPRAMRKRLDTR